MDCCTFLGALCIVDCKNWVTILFWSCLSSQSLMTVPSMLLALSFLLSLASNARQHNGKPGWLNTSLWQVPLSIGVHLSWVPSLGRVELSHSQRCFLCYMYVVKLAALKLNYRCHILPALNCSIITWAFSVCLEQITVIYQDAKRWGYKQSGVV